jgi:hypothetical protein
LYRARSAWPESEYQLDRQLRRADELHRDYVAARARYNYGAGIEAARAKSSGDAAVRARQAQDVAGYELEVERLVAAGYSAGTARLAAIPMIYR